MSNFDSNETIQFTSSKPVYDFYVAGPYETAEQVESMERLEKVLNDRGMSVYRPRFAMDVNVSGPQAVFANRIAAIANSRAVIANMDATMQVPSSRSPTGMRLVSRCTPIARGFCRTVASV